MTSGTLDITLPALQTVNAAAPSPAVDLEVVLPSLVAHVEATLQHNRQVVFLPVLTADVEVTVPVTADFEVALPMLSVETDLNPVPIPEFDVVLTSMRPSVWWAMDASDDTGPMSDDYWGPGFNHLRDRSGHGYDGAIANNDSPVPYSAGIVTDSTESSWDSAPGTKIWALAENAPEGASGNVLSGVTCSAFVLVDYQPPAGDELSYVNRVPIQRLDCWMLTKYHGAWWLLTYSGYSTVMTRLTDDTTVEEVASLGVVISPATQAGYVMVQGFVNGAPAPYTPEPTQVAASDWATHDADPYSTFAVGLSGDFTGLVQHAAYFAGKQLGSGDFAALHASAFVARPRPDDVRVTLPSLSADVEVAVPDHITQDVALPMLSAAAYTGVPGRTPIGGTSWQTAAVLVRGEIAQASPRELYPQYDPSGLVWPYYSAWWKWTADVDTQVWFSTFRSIPEPGRSLDTVLVAYTERAGNLTTVATSDDVANWKASQVVIDHPVIGQTYYIRCGAQDSYGAGIAFYVLDNDLCPRPTLADLIVEGGSRGPAGAGAAAGSIWPGSVPTIGDNSVSTPTHIPAGEQAWWAWTADYTGTVSFDTLLTQNWFTGGVGTTDPMVGLELWDSSQFLAYSAANGTAEHVTNQGQISWNVTAGQTYHIAVYPLPNFPDISAILRISQIAQTGVVVPPPKSIILDITPQSRNVVADALHVSADQLHYASEVGSNKIDSSTATVMAAPSSANLSGFSGSYTISRAFAGLEPQLDHMGVLQCLWEHVRIGTKPPYNQDWGHDAQGNPSGYWYGPDDPYDDHGSAGYGVCAMYSQDVAAGCGATNDANQAGVSYGATVNSLGFFTYANASMTAIGSHWQVGLTDLVKAIRARSDVSSSAALAGISLMADEPNLHQENIWEWFVNVTDDKNPSGIRHWGPSYDGGWWSIGPSDAEPNIWMSRSMFTGQSPMLGGGAPAWTPLPSDLLAQILTFESNPANDQDSTHKGRGLTLAYLPPQVARPDPPDIVWRGFGYEVAHVDAYSYGCRVLAKVDVQEPAYVTTGQPLGSSGNAFPTVVAYNPSTGGYGGFPPPLNPGPVSSQILFGPYPVRFTPVIDVLVFGPRHKDMYWPEVQATPRLGVELGTDAPVAPTNPLLRPQGTVRFAMPEFTMLDGKPVGSKVSGRLVIESQTVTPALVSTLFSNPELVSLGESYRFSPALATAKSRTISNRRHPGFPLVYSAIQEVVSLPSADGSVKLLVEAAGTIGPDLASSYTYWRGSPAAASAISFHSDVAEQSLVNSGDWRYDQQATAITEITILMAVVLRNEEVVGPLSPLFCFSGYTGPACGLFFNSNSELLLWDNQHAVTDPAKRIRGSLQLVDDIRRVSQPVLVGARITVDTGKVTLIAADSRIRTVESSLVASLDLSYTLMIGDAGALTSAGAFDMLDMRWWSRPLSDDELLTAAAAMSDLWGVLQ